jgi:tetratricopeptide (TPR) repeat protein
MNDTPQRSAVRQRRAAWIAVVAITLVTTAGASGSTPVADLQPVTHPDLANMDPAVQRQIEEQKDALLAALERPDAPPAELAEAFGKMGMLYQLYEYMLSATDCYGNAQRLAPGDYRWPYLTGHVALNTGDLAAAVSAFERALEIRPDDIPALVWLGEVQRSRDRSDEAATMFARAAELDANCLAARFGLGQIALARGEPGEAVEHFQAVLQRNPRLPTVHYNLGMAYRGLGELDRARTHLEAAASRADATRDIDPIMAGMNDPLLIEIQALTTGEQAHRSRAAAAMAFGRPDAAARELRKAIELDPSDPLTRRMLADVLAAQGDLEGAVEQLVAATAGTELRRDERATVEVGLGRLYERLGRFEDAERVYRAAVERLPERTDARSGLARALLLSGRAEPAIDAFNELLEVDSEDAAAHFWRAMTLLRLRRWSEARDGFEAGLAVRPGDVRLTSGLARLLAACPDDSVRDGSAALALIGQLAETRRLTPMQIETLAMALAETGDFATAIRWQQRLIAEARRLQLPDLVKRLAANLALYQDEQPCRVAWPDDDPIFLPPPGG